MEQEIHTRWAFPGTFAAVTFLWLAYVFGTPSLDRLQGSWLTAIVALLTGVPAVGFLAHSLAYGVAGGYHGRRLWGLGALSEARNMLLWRCGRELGLTEKPPCERLGEMDKDVLFALAGLGAHQCRQAQAMPERLHENARRRWTICWAAWNSTAGVALGGIVYAAYILYHSGHWGVIGKSSWAVGPALLLLAILWSAGRQVRRRVWDLELGWLILWLGQPENE